MFYSEAILSRRGPLGKVWLAAHMERKLSKTQTLQTDIEESVDAIIDQNAEFMALRLSGQLLLGVVRIYNRKAKYLLEDCNEALMKIKMAFRPGLVDMAEEQLVINQNAITLQGTGGIDIDALMPDFNWEMDLGEQPLLASGHHQANVADITLRTVDDFDPLGSQQLFDADGMGSQDFEGLDLGIDWGDGQLDETRDNLSIDGSVGVGRDAINTVDSVDGQFINRLDKEGDIFSQRSLSRASSEHPLFPPMDIDMTIPHMETGMEIDDLGISFEDHDESGIVQEKARSPSRGSSPLTDLPMTPPPDPLVNGEATPVPKKRKMKEKKQIIDSVLELADSQVGGRGRSGPGSQDLSAILTEPHFLPRSTVIMRLLEIQNDPVSYFLPTKVTPDGTFFCAAPPGLAPELAELFMRPVNGAPKRRGKSPGKSSKKRPRLDSNFDVDEDVELGRRAGSLAPSLGVGSDIINPGDGGLDFPEQSMTFDDYLPVNDIQHDDTTGFRSKSAAPSELSRLSTPPPDNLLDDLDDSYADASCPIAMFDTQPMTQTQNTQEVEKEMDREVESSNAEGKGYSKNTIKALGIIRRELRPSDGADDEEKAMSFRKMADKASRRAAASFFFELLVLGTRDCIRLTQSGAFENIEVRPKDKLWEQHHHGISQGV